MQGWRFGVCVAAGTACTALVINLLALIVLTSKFRHTIKSGIGTTIMGDCNKVDAWATFLHIGTTDRFYGKETLANFLVFLDG